MLASRRVIFVMRTAANAYAAHFCKSTRPMRMLLTSGPRLMVFITPRTAARVGARFQPALFRGEQGITGILISFDTSSPVSGGKTQGIYISSNGTGIYHTTNGGISWTELASTGMPTTFSKLVVDESGTVWVVDGANAPNGNLLRYLNGSWSRQLSISRYQISAVAINPADTNEVYAVDYSGCLLYTTGGQSGNPSWIEAWKRPRQRCDGGYPPTAFTIASTKIPWMQWAKDRTLNIQSLAFDSSQTNVLYAGTGIGVFRTSPPTSGTMIPTWNGDETIGIENLDLVSGVALPSGGLFFTAQDRPAWFLRMGEYPSQYGPAAETAGQEVVAGQTSGCADGKAAMALSIHGLTATVNGGASWSPWLPAANGRAVFGNCIPISATRWLWLSSQDVGPYITTDAGATWSACTFTNAIGGGAVTGAGGGWNASQFQIQKIAMAQDTTAPSTILLFNNGTGVRNGAAATGIWKMSSTSGCAFNQVYKSAFPSPLGYIATSLLKAAPGQPCTFFSSIIVYIHGELPVGDQLYKTVDCGAHWSAIPQVKSFINWGFGAAKPGGDGFPAFYCACWVNIGRGYTYGIWESDNIDQTSPTWTNIDPEDSGFPTGNFDTISFLVGDLKTYGTVYVGFGGSGGAYRTRR